MDKLRVSSFLVAMCAFVACIQNVYAGASPNVASINCTQTTDCSSVKNATCVGKNCTCEAPFKIAGPECAWKVINDSCTQNTDCVHVPHSSCEGSPKRCTCTGGFKVSGTTCVKRVVGDTCTAATDCPLNGNCNKTCVCKTGSIADNGLCRFAVGKNCAQKSECVSNADCDNTTKKCKCTSGYDDSKGLCLKHSDSDSSAISVRLTIPLLVMSVLTVVFERIQ